MALLNTELAKLDKALSDPLLFTRDPAKAAELARKRSNFVRDLSEANAPPTPVKLTRTVGES